MDEDTDMVDDYQQAGGPDGDGDGIPDACDLIFNDVDGDGVGDAVDLDDDNDGILDTVECSATYNSIATGDNVGDGDFFESFINWITFDDLGAAGTALALGQSVNLTNNYGDVLTVTVAAVNANGENIAFDTAPNVGSLFSNGYDIGTNGTTLSTIITSGAGGVAKTYTLSFSAVDSNANPIPANIVIAEAEFAAGPSSGGGLLETVTVTAGSGVLSLLENLGGSDYLISSGAIGTPSLSYTDTVYASGPAMQFTSPLLLNNNASTITIEFNNSLVSAQKQAFGWYTRAACDTDLDGIADYLDLDSDNDGIYDVVESGGTPSGATGQEGRADDDDNNADNTGSPSLGVPTSAGAGNTPTETTAGIPDYLNLDSDGDGCSDANEAYDSSTVDGGDTGVFGADPVDPTTIVDPDGSVTAASYPAPADGDTDGTDDYQQVGGPDGDGDGIPDACDLIFNDIDGDGVGDVVDLDDDNDGILDSVEQDCDPTLKDLNNPVYSMNIDLVNAPTPGAINDIAPYKDANMDVAFQLMGGAAWAANGVQIRQGNGPGIGNNGVTVGQNFIYLQGDTTDYNNGDVIEFTLSFNQLISNLSFFLGGLDNTDTARFEPFINGQALTVSPSNFSNFNTPMQRSSNEVVGQGSGSSNFRENEVKFSFEQAIDELKITFAKVGPSASSIITLAIYELNYCLADTDGDGVPDSLDLDSDNDGIYDVVESGGTDTNNDGRADDDDNNVDNTGSGTAGVPTSAGAGTTPIETIVGSLDYIDIDSDDDGIPDNVEGQPTVGYCSVCRFY